jgi:hypothetical protein
MKVPVVSLPIVTMRRQWARLNLEVGQMTWQRLAR